MYPKVVLYDYALKFIGQPYRWGGDDPIDGFDCSGLVLELLQSVGVWPKGVDANAQGIHDHFTGTVSEPGFGVLAFYGKSTKEITHVAFCLGELLKLEAGGGGSHTVTRTDAAEQNAYVRIRPIKSRVDLIGLKLPPYPWKG